LSKRDDSPTPTEAEPAPKRKRRRKRSKRRGGSNPTADGRAASESKQDPDAAGGAKPKRKWPNPWLILLAVGVLEVWLFGRRGHLEVCVARDGEHDFALLGTPRDDSNTKRYPTCEKRLNIGLTSRYQQAHDDAMLRACQRATVLRGKTMTIACALSLEGWQQRTEESWCPPWHDHYYKRLFWFLE
jgi:hypothetical protein